MPIRFLRVMIVGWVMVVGLVACSAPSTPPPVTATIGATETPTATATASSTPEPSPTPTASPEPTATPEPPAVIGPDGYDEDVNPLTGLRVDDPSVLERRPLLIKISNAPPIVRPQSCLSSADMIFEHYAEGGWTRFTALFYSQSCDHVGSVRSVRLIDISLTPAFDGILIFSGGSLGVIDTLQEAPIYPKNVISPQFGYGEPTFVRFPREGLPFEHTLFTDTDLLWSIITEREINRRPDLSTPGLAFTDLPPDGGSPASTLEIEYARTNVMWRYDPTSHTYLRWTDGLPHSDALTGQQIAFENIMVISTYHEEIELFPEKYFGAEKSLYIEMLGEGPATLMRDGQAYEGRWVRADDEDQFTFYGIDGAAMLMKPGQTFFQIIRFGFERLILEP